MIVYLDTSALVKLYVKEPGREEVLRELAAAMAVATLRIAYAEARAAFARRAREKSLAPGDLRRAVWALDEDWDRYLCLEVSERVVRLAGDLAEKYGLRGFDSLHLAAAAWLRGRVSVPVKFLCFASRLAETAVHVLQA